MAKAMVTHFSLDCSSARWRVGRYTEHLPRGVINVSLSPYAVLCTAQRVSILKSGTPHCKLAPYFKPDTREYRCILLATRIQLTLATNQLKTKTPTLSVACVCGLTKNQKGRDTSTRKNGSISGFFHRHSGARY